jgi:hypothetical protein
MATKNVIALAIFFALFASWAPAQTQQQLAEVHSISEKDWTDTLDYCGWLLNAQFWIEHPDSEYAKQFFAQLNLSAADDAAFRGIVADFHKRHDQLMADSYAKLDSSAWNPETQTELVLDLVATTNDAIRRIRTDLSADGARKVDSRART